MPLFEPADHSNLSYSARMSGEASRVDELDAELLRTPVVRAAADVPGQAAALRRLAALSLDARSARVFETVAYAQLLTGDAEAATLTLAAARQLPRTVDAAARVAEVFDRMADMEALLLAGAEGDAVA
jgi:hypothetical protein